MVNDCHLDVSAVTILILTNDDDTCKKTNVIIFKDCPMFSEQMLISLTKP